jgi:hypothetical protein
MDGCGGGPDLLGIHMGGWGGVIWSDLLGIFETPNGGLYCGGELPIWGAEDSVHMSEDVIS